MSQVKPTDTNNQRNVADVSHPDNHLGKQLAMRIEPSDGTVAGRLRLRPSMWGAGSTRPRLAIVAAAIDSLAGHVPSSVHVPTVDLRAQFVAEPPSEGVVELSGHALRVGGRLIVSEFEVRDDTGAVFARATATMSNRHFGGWVPVEDIEPADPIPSFDELLNAYPVDERSLHLDPSPQIANGLFRTLYGGAQALVCELAAEHAAGQPRAAVDIDIRFLRPGEVGPLRATATRTGTVGELDAFRVDLTDEGADGALVAAVTVLSRPVGC